MARNETHIVAQGPQSGADRLQQRLVVPARKIGAKLFLFWI